MAGITNMAFEADYEGIICGVDEAGRGPWAGPVVAGAAIIHTPNLPAQLNDSKKLSRARREALFPLIHAIAHVGVGIASAEEIDALNILAATKLAMTRAVEALNQTVDVALIDGNQPPKLSCKTIPVIKGDSKSASIAAASIIAKVTRDSIMDELAHDFPHYGWESNAGYGTKAHQEALHTHGVTVHHRRSFAPIRKLLEAAKAA